MAIFNSYVKFPEGTQQEAILWDSHPSAIGDMSKDVYDGLVDPSAISRGAYWFHVHIMDLGLRGRLGQGTRSSDKTMPWNTWFMKMMVFQNMW